MNLRYAITRLDRACGCPLGRLEYAWCMLAGRPYFGTLYAAGQGNRYRYAHMKDLMIVVAEQAGCDAYLQILEIGSWAGGSATVWADALKKANRCKGTIHCVDPWIAYFDPRSSNPIHRAMNKAGMGGSILPLFQHNTRAYGSMIVPHVGRSWHVLPVFKEQFFDLVYIDGDHSFRTVLGDIDQSTPLLKDGAILCGDDLELQWDDVDTLVLQANLGEDYAQDPKTGKHHHPGVTMAVREFFGRRISAYDGFWVVRKKGDTWQDLTW